MGETTTSTGMSSFVNEINDGLSADNIWGAIAPVAVLIITITIVAITRRIINKNLNATKSGKAGKV